MKFEEQRCDRCSKPIKPPYIKFIIRYHHPRTLDICRECEGAFALWLGKHPLWNTPLADILNGSSSGDGYPSNEQVAEFKDQLSGSNPEEYNKGYKRGYRAGVESSNVDG